METLGITDKPASQYWVNGSPKKFFWRQQLGSKSRAITELLNGTMQTAGECQGAIVACYWWAVFQVLGNEEFEIYNKGNLDEGMFIHLRDTNQTGYGFEAVDNTIYVPGDWVYMQNFNYNAIIDTKWFYDVNALKRSTSYPWSGENAIFCGNEKYNGLGLKEKDEKAFRDELMNSYNDDLKDVFSHKQVKQKFVVYGEQWYEELMPITNETALTKIRWARCFRPYIFVSFPVPIPPRTF